MAPDAPEPGLLDLADPDDAARVIADAAATARPRCGDVVVVAIDGPSGAGKTTIAGPVAEALACPVVHMDELYPGWDGLAEAVGLVDDLVLGPLARGEDLRYRRWDWAADRWGEEIALPWTPVLVLEGCGSSVRPAGERAALRVWVDADRAERRARGIARDGDTFAPHWERWAEQEDALFAADRTRERADLEIIT